MTIHWDYNLLVLLCLVTGKSPRGLQETVKKLAEDLGIELEAGA